MAMIGLRLRLRGGLKPSKQPPVYVTALFCRYIDKTFSIVITVNKLNMIMKKFKVAN